MTHYCKVLGYKILYPPTLEIYFALAVDVLSIHISFNIVHVNLVLPTWFNWLFRLIELTGDMSSVLPSDCGDKVIELNSRGYYCPRAIVPPTIDISGTNDRAAAIKWTISPERRSITRLIRLDLDLIWLLWMDGYWVSMATAGAARDRLPIWNYYKLFVVVPGPFNRYSAAK